MLNSALKGLDKYSKTARRGFLLIVKDNTGLHRFGTKNLVLKFSKSQDCHSCQEEESWEEAARNDTKDLNSEDLENVHVTAPQLSNQENLITSLFDAAEVPKLPFDVDLLSEKEAGAWLLPELKKDLVENGSKPVNRIAWGEEKFHPKCWADDLAEWGKVSNMSSSKEQS